MHSLSLLSICPVLSLDCSLYFQNVWHLLSLWWTHSWAYTLHRSHREPHHFHLCGLCLFATHHHLSHYPLVDLSFHSWRDYRTFPLVFYSDLHTLDCWSQVFKILHLFHLYLLSPSVTLTFLSFTYGLHPALTNLHSFLVKGILPCSLYRPQCHPQTPWSMEIPVQPHLSACHSPQWARRGLNLIHGAFLPPPWTLSCLPHISHACPKILFCHSIPPHTMPRFLSHGPIMCFLLIYGVLHSLASITISITSLYGSSTFSVAQCSIPPLSLQKLVEQPSQILHSYLFIYSNYPCSSALKNTLFIPTSPHRSPCLVFAT